MKSNISKLLQIPIHPLFFSVYPIISLYIRNYFLVPLGEFFIIFIFNTVFMIAFWWGVNNFSKNINKSAIIVSSFYILFFSFGHFLPALTNILIFYFDINIKTQLLGHTSFWNILMISIWIGLFITMILLTVKPKSDFQLVTSLMNIISLTLAFFVIIQSAQKTIQFHELVSEDNEINDNSLDALVTEPLNGEIINQNKLPDIYYIILDGYASSESLEKYYNYDNHEILEILSDSGFYIAGESNSNYSQTILSLASSLNLDYLNDITNLAGKFSNNPVPLVKLIKFNRLIEFLEQAGYKSITFESGYSVTDIPSSDQFLSPEVSLTPFQNQLINLTPLRVILNKYQYDNHRRRILYIFDQLPEVQQIDQPAFIFAHIISPHPPFAFGSNGEFEYLDIEFSLSDGSDVTDIISKEEYQIRYRNQVKFLNIKLQDAIEKILARSDGQAIIVIQADHGPGSMLDWSGMENSNIDERMSILNAYYFSDQNYSNLYPSISPVNTFRIVLDQYFGTNLGIIKDVSYFSIIETPYQFIDVTDELN